MGCLRWVNYVQDSEMGSLMIPSHFKGNLGHFKEVVSYFHWLTNYT
jgi:hypothetical protein